MYYSAETMMHRKYEAPCRNCPRKGCGPYHDKCEQYQEYVRKCKDKQNKDRHPNPHYNDTHFT